MDEPQYVYILIKDWGYEGMSAPNAAFIKLEEARAVQQSLAQETCCYKIFKVALFPSVESVEEIT